MQKLHRMTFPIAVTLAMCLMTAACATKLPPASLSQARTAYDQLATDPEVVKYAPGALYKAKKAIERAEAGWNRERDTVRTNNHAYIADKRIAIARAVAQQELAQAATRQNSEAQPHMVPEPLPQPALAEAEATQDSEAQPHMVPEPLPQPALAGAEATQDSEAQPHMVPEPLPQPALAEAEATQDSEAQPHMVPEPLPQPALAEAEATQDSEAQPHMVPEPLPQPALAEAEATQDSEAQPHMMPEPLPQPALAEAEATQDSEAQPHMMPEPLPQPALAGAEATQDSEAQPHMMPEPLPQPALAEAEATQDSEAQPHMMPEPLPQPALAEAEETQDSEAQPQIVPEPRETVLEAHEREVAALKALKAKQTSRGAVVTLGDRLFESAGRDLSIDAIRTLIEVATFLHEYPERTVAIEGHTDSIGPEGFNVTVSRRRAKSVQNILLDGGVEQARISAEGYGEAHPVAPNNSRAGRQRNRRVELVIQSPDIPAKTRP